MPVLLLIMGGVLITAALRNKAGDLGAALATDVPAYMRWAGALAGVLALGWIPGGERPARLLAGLVIAVLVLKNYAQIVAGLKHAAGTTTASAAPIDPASAVAANPRNPAITPASVAGSSGNVNANAAGKILNTIAPGLVPQQYLDAFGPDAAHSGYGGTA